MVAGTMFLRAKVRKKDGKQHRYFSVVENRRVGKNKTAQRTVLYLGEINDGQEATWRKTVQVFDESQQQHTTLSLFPEDREIPAESSDIALPQHGGMQSSNVDERRHSTRNLLTTAIGLVTVYTGPASTSTMSILS